MKPSKRGGESMNADKISKLPDDLILHILSLLPTKSAVATTSVLSKQWKFLWKMMPKLEFNSRDHKGELGTFSNNVCKSLLSHKALVLESLHLKFRVDSCDATDIGMWIGIAYAQHVRKLVLNVDATVLGSFKLPRSLYNCEILESLSLKGCFVYLNVPSQVCLKSLKTLHLQRKFIIKEASFLKLLSGCPNLEDLLVHTNRYDEMNFTFTIAVPSLQRLSICTHDHRCVYVINAPSLKYLKIEGNHGLEFRLIENVTSLVEANIIENASPIVNNRYVSHMVSENLLRWLTSVKRLSLEILPLKITFPCGIIFYQLVHLELYTSREAWWNLLTFMLRDSPKLRVLKLINSQNHWRKDFMPSGKWKKPKSVPKCLLFHLETFMWEGYNEWLVKDELKVAKYILRNAYLLKRATFSLNDMSSEYSGNQLIKDLKNVERASDPCELLFKYIY